jgi:ribose transport system ATP-binding protein
VLKGVDLEIARGEVHGIVGENGAGKSTMVNILTGLLRRDAGEIFIDAEAHAPKSVADGFASGVSFAAQELSLIDTLTVAENIALRRLPCRHSVIERELLEKSARRSLDSVGLQDLPPNVLVESLSLAERQLVEIAKAISSDCRLLILDEPTAALTADQAERVHSVIAELAGNGTSIIYISHRLEDIIEVCDNVTVLRDGHVVSVSRSGQTNVDELVSLMTGETFQARNKEHGNMPSLRPVLSAKQLSTAELQYPVDLTCHAGEIVGVAGLAGAGKSELLQALFGLAPRTGGELLRHGDEVESSINNSRQSVRSGVGFLGEDRQSMGVFPGQSVLTNMMLPDLSRSRASRLDNVAEDSAGNTLRDRLAIRCDRLQQDIRELSGGNQQKVLLARWLNCEADVLLLDEPTRGVDVGTKQSIYDLFVRLKSDGKSLLIASSELEELLAVCDRIVVMSNRRLVAEFSARDCSEEQILAAAFSGYGNNQSSTRQSTSPGHETR